MKSNDRKHHSYEQMTPPVEEFGLGIQVFKIESNKLLDGDRQNQRRAIKNIENPAFVKAAVFPVKKPQVLPSLSTEKRSKFSGNNETLKERRTTVEKKKLSNLPDTVKEGEEKRRGFQKKSVSTQQVLKNALPEQPAPLPKEKEKIQLHYRKSMNQIVNFYSRLEEAEADNLKEIRRLKKLKDGSGQGEEQLAREMRLRENKSEMVLEMVYQDGLREFEMEQEYDEYDISIYSEGGGRFSFQDEPQTH